MAWTVCDIRPYVRPSDLRNPVGSIVVKIGTWVHFGV